MPYWLESDTFGDDQVWDALADGNADRRDRLQAAYCRLKAKSSHLLTDGYLTADLALRYARNNRALLDRLTVPVLGRPPRLHRRGDQCDCLAEEWVDGYDFRIHAFLRRNPSRSEYRRNRAQRADLRDPRLRQAVYTRDGGCCRYCRSGPLSPKAGRSRDRRKVLHFDHPDPDAPAGVRGKNLVVCCGRCNEHKGHRTPQEADMVLLAEPTAEQRAQWLTEDLALFDLDQRQNHRQNSGPINDGTETEQTSEQKHDADRISDPISDRDGDPIDVATGPVCPVNSADTPEQHAISAGEGARMGRVGKPVSDASAGRLRQPPRPAEAPDVYHRRSRPPAAEPGYVWPPGAVPVTGRGEQP